MEIKKVNLEDFNIFNLPDSAMSAALESAVKTYDANLKMGVMNNDSLPAVAMGAIERLIATIKQEDDADAIKNGLKAMYSSAICCLSFDSTEKKVEIQFLRKTLPFWISGVVAGINDILQAKNKEIKNLKTTITSLSEALANAKV